jgi:hypothetical protein
MRIHNHHIIPRHSGGTDDPSNLIELTIEEHAEAHKQLWLMNHDWQDEVAYKVLSGAITFEEGRIEAVRNSKVHKEAAKKLCVERNTSNNPMKPGMVNSGSFKKGHSYKMSDERKMKISLKLVGNKSTSGKIWITNGYETCYSSGEIPYGWRRGRK